MSRDGTRALRGIQSDAKAESLQQNAAMKSEQCIQTHDQIVLYQHGNRDTSAGILTIVPLPIDRDLFHRLPRRRQPANKILNRYHLPSEDEYFLPVTVTAAWKAFVNKENDIAQSVESKKAKQAIKAPPPIRSWQARLSRQPPTLPRVSSIVALTSNEPDLRVTDLPACIINSIISSALHPFHHW